MYDQLLQVLSDIFGKIKISITNLNLGQKGEVVFDFNGKNTIKVGEGGVTVEQLNSLLGPDGTVLIHGSRIIDDTLDASLKLTDRTINEVKIELGSIKDELINSLANIDGSKLSAGTVTTTQLYAGAVNALKISAINVRTDQAVITGTAQIADAIITSAKINDLSVAKLTSGTIASQSIVLSGTGYIQSSGYTAGSVGWQINSSGSAEFNNVTVRGTVVISAGSSGYANISDKPTALSTINATEGSKLAGIEAGATVGANWTTNVSARPTELTDGRIVAGLNGSGEILKTIKGVNLPSTGMVAGLNMTSGYLGYYSGTAWTAYIQSNGNFYFGGDGSNYIQWNGSSLVVRGNVQATSATFAYAGSSYAGGPANDTSYVNGTASSSVSQGATRANNALDSNSRYTKWLDASSITETKTKTGYTGVIVDGGGISGWNAGTKTFEVNTSGTAYFAGSIYASTINATVTLSGGTIQTGSSGQRIVIDSTTMKFYNSGNALCGTLYGFNSGTYGATVNADSANFSVDYILANGRDAYFCAQGTSYTARFMGKMRIPVGSNLY